MLLQIRYAVSGRAPPDAPRILVLDPLVVLPRFLDVPERRILLVGEAVQVEQLVVTVRIQLQVAVQCFDGRLGALGFQFRLCKLYERGRIDQRG